MMKKYLSLAACIKDDGYYVREWLTFHEMLGVEQFYIALHNCTDNTESEIRSLPFFEKKIKLYRVNTPDDGKNRQTGIYSEIIKTHKNDTEWMIFIDGDEFLFGTEIDDLRDVVSLYDNYNGVCVNWLLFNACGHEERPPLPTIKHYRTRIDHNKDGPERFRRALGSVKSIVKPRHVTGIYASHLFAVKGFMVNEAFHPVEPRRGMIWQSGHPNSYEILRINHYLTRSKACFARRMQRGANTSSLNAVYNDAYFRDMQSENIEDLTIQRFVPELETRLFL